MLGLDAEERGRTHGDETLVEARRRENRAEMLGCIQLRDSKSRSSAGRVLFMCYGQAQGSTPLRTSSEGFEYVSADSVNEGGSGPSMPGCSRRLRVILDDSGIRIATKWRTGHASGVALNQE